MERRGIDALVLGREANARAVSGADRLWLVGHARVRAGMRGRAQHGRGPPARQQQRRLRGASRASASTAITWNPGEAARCAARDPRTGRREHGRRRRHVAGHARAASASSAPRARARRRRPDLRRAVARAFAREDRRRARSRARSRATGSRRWRRPSATACARASCAACARERFAVARRDDARVRGGRGADRRWRVHVAAARTAPRRGRERRAPRRRAAQRLGSVARAHLRGRRTLDRAAAAGRLGRRSWRCAARAPASGTSAISKRSCTASGAGVEPYDDELELEAGMVFALELHRGRRLHQDVLHLTDDGAR